ncbi:MAG: hypothetical protein A2X36_03950 [Elusimicrobia bacterium GWA2_69_24]|nr:MAG: hypothetical protein A2X36_03950 [Elusimicrobia bacterium GWA2_69_24]HBL17946.1 hypothetical protein [Elusimicrobiota bacterium]
MPKLLLKFNAAVIKEIVFDKPSFSVGRKPDNDIVIDNPAVSGHHCKLANIGDTYFVEDLESTNGTYVNQKRVMKAGLHHNDVVTIARHSIVFLEDAPPPGADKTMVLPPAAVEALAASPGPSPALEIVAAAAELDSAPPAAASEPAAGAPAMESAPAVSPDKTLPPAASPQRTLPPEPVPPAAATTTARLRVLKGAVSQPEFELKGTSTYIGKSDRAQVPIQGSGIFKSAPEVAASIHRKGENYTLMAIKDGYPKVNGADVTGQVPLKDGDIIVCGGTTLQFCVQKT